jgi:ABC-2 type transport system permease protein
MNAWQALLWTLRSIVFDKGAVLPAVGGVVLYFLFYPLPYLPEVVRDVPVVVADYDAGPLSRQIERDLDASQAVVVEGTTRTVEDALPRLQSGEIGGIVVVPPDFHRDVLRGTPTGVTVMANGGYIVVDGTILEAATQVVAETAAPAYAARLLQSNVPASAVTRLTRSGPLLVKQPLFNTVQGYASYVVPASMGLIVHQLLIIAICLVVGSWVEAGRWAIASDGRLSLAAFAGMVGGFWLMVFAAIMFWIGFVFWYHDLPRAGNLPGAIAFGAMYALAVACTGVALGCWMGTRERALQVIGGISIPLLFLSGFAFPVVENLSPPLVWLSHLLPSTPGIQGFIKLNQMGATWSETQPQVVNLLLLIFLYGGLAWWAASRRASGLGSSEPRTDSSDSEGLALSRAE